MGAGARKKMESPSRGPREEGAGAGARAKKEWEPGPREERGSKDTNTKRRGDKDDGEQDSIFPRHMTLSYQAPHKPVSKNTLARWLRQVLNGAGVN